MLSCCHTCSITKAGVDMLTKAAAVELADKVHPYTSSAGTAMRMQPYPASL